MLQDLQRKKKTEKEERKNAILKGKKTSIKERLKKESEKQQRYIDIADKYAKSHGGVNYKSVFKRQYMHI